MPITISESIFRQTVQYLTSQSNNGDRPAQELLKIWQSVLPNSEAIPDFDRRLFTTWQELADLQIGENCWSYPVPIADIAENLSVSIENLIQHLETTQIQSLQLLPGRGINYIIKSNQIGDLAFHSAPNFSKSPTDLLKGNETVFKVGDRIKVNGNRPQYANQTGTIEQVISVSCRIKFDNDWIAFLPNHCLEKI